MPFWIQKARFFGIKISMSAPIPKVILALLLLAVFVLPNFTILAEEGGEQERIEETQEQDERNITLLQERETLEKELEELEKQIAQYEGNISATQLEKKSFQNQIYILQNKIKKLDLQIYQSDTMIKDVGLQIKDTEGSIEKTSSKIEELKESLVEVLRLIYEKDQKSAIEILLSSQRLSDFFEEVAALESLSDRNRELLENIRNLKSSLQNQKISLGDEKSEIEELLKIQLLQKKESQSTKTEQEWLLESTKGQESEYQRLLSESKKRAQEIRARIFELIGVPKAPTFGEALELALYVEKITGVRPALLLAVLTQESRIGQNVGQCYLPEDPAENLKRRVMAAGPPASKRDDVFYFLKITQELGRDPYSTPISCPMQYGWGGAMGPAQFIPTTWADPHSSPTKVSYKERVEELTKNAPADPWQINDAFLAAALYLGDYGAKSRTANSEWRAAMIYFSGSTNTEYRFYGDSVLRIAEQYEQDIKELE